MKKNIFLIALFIIILMPFNVNALSIKSIRVSQPKENIVGDIFLMPVDVSFSGLDSKKDGSGIYMVMLAVDVDDDILEIPDVYTDFYESTIYVYEGIYYIISITDPTASGNKCADQFLGCTDYSANLNIKIKNDTKEEAEIKVLGAAIGYFDIDTTLESYNLDSMKELEYEEEIIRMVKIIKNDESNTSNKEESNSNNNKENENNKNNNIIVEDKIPEIKDETIENSKQNANSSNNGHKKSSNAFLKDLTIENYEIDFQRGQNYYEITIPNNVKSLNITVNTEDKLATYEIIGADNLKESVDIVVKAEDGTKKTYTINILKETITKEEAKWEKLKKQIIKFLSKYYLFIIGGMLVITIVIIVIKYQNNKKIDKIIDSI